MSPTPARAPIVTFLTDYGLDDPFVGLCHATVLGIAGNARIVDLCHHVRPQDVRTGASLLADCVPYLPPAIHVAVVDPGVGTARRAIAVRAGDHLFVGPDNGLLWPAVQRAGGVDGAWELTDPAYHRVTVSRTFHGRDVFAPVAGHLAAGVAAERLGPPIAPQTFQRIELAGAATSMGEVTCEVAAIDRFGNVQLSASAGDLAAAGFVPSQRVEASAGPRRFALTVAEAFEALPSGALGVLEDSFGHAAIFCNGADAARRLDLAVGDRLVLRRATQTGTGGS